VDTDLGRVAYEAYAQDCGYKSIRGDDLPVWLDQDPAIQAHWDAAAKAVAAAVVGDQRGG
jgi:hypothetical protein